MSTEQNSEQLTVKRHSQPPRRDRRKWFVGAIIIGLLLLFALAPTIASMTPLGKQFVRWATADIDGTVDVGSVSAGWFSPIKLSEVTLTDSEGHSIANVGMVQVSKSLFGLLTSSDLGTITVRDTNLNVVVTDGKTNLEVALAKYFNAEPSTQPPRHLVVSVENATIQLVDGNSGQTDTIRDVAANIELANDNSALTAEATGVFVASEDRRGALAIKAVAGSADDPSFERGQANVASDQLPLDCLATLLKRFGIAAKTQGDLTSKLEVSWNGSGREVGINVIQLEVDRFAIEAPSWLGQDRLVIERGVSQGQLNFAPAAIVAHQFEFESELGSASANGRIDASQIAALVAEGRLMTTDFEVNGRIDLARLARVLPNTLRVKPGVEIEAGELVLQSYSRMEAGQRRILVNLEAQNIQARNQGRPMRWQAPIRVVAAMRQNDQGSELEHLQVKTRAIDIEGRATKEAGQFKATGDFDALMQQAGQFFDFGNFVLAGQFRGALNWQLQEGAETPGSTWPVEISGNLDCQETKFVWPGIGEWIEPNLLVQLRAKGTLDQNRSMNIPQGMVVFTAGNDRLQAELTQPVVDPDFQTTLPLKCRVTGRFANWLGRISNFLPDVDFASDGQLTLTGNAALNVNGVQIDSAQYTIDQFSLVGYGLNVEEQRVQGQGAVTIDWSKYLFYLSDVSLASSSISARAKETQFHLTERGWKMDGQVAFRGDANRVSQWMGKRQQPPSVGWFGLIHGQLTLQSEGDQIAGRLDAAVDDLQIARSVARGESTAPHQLVNDSREWQVFWKESPVTLKTQWRLRSDLQQIEFRAIKLNSRAFRAEAAGSIDDLFGNLVFDLQGNWQPDWQVVSRVAEGYTNQPIAIQGNAAERFQIHGPLFAKNEQGQSGISREFTVKSAARWDSGEILGMPVGTGVIEANLRDRFLALGNSSVELAGGTLNLPTAVNFQGTVPVVVLREGYLLQDVELKPEVCHGWLKYISPLLADTAQAEGRFSVATDRARLPLFAPWNGKANAQVMIQEANVSAGPLAMQMIQLVETVKNVLAADSVESQLGALQRIAGQRNQSGGQPRAVLMKMPAQEIGVRLDQKRIYNDGVTFLVGDTSVRTSGSVGIDQSINLVAEVPISDSWIRGKDWMASLHGQSVKIPIGGTIGRPQIDHRALRQLAMQLAERAGKQRVSQEITNRIGEIAPREFRDVIGNLGKQGGNAPQNGASSIQEQLQRKLDKKLGEGLDKIFGPKK